MDEDVLEAKDVYILMKKEYRISRNIRAEWYLKRIDTLITISRKSTVKDFQGELEVASVLPHNPPSDWDSDTAHEYKYLVTERTQLHFLARKYRLVFCIDLSPSLTVVNLESGRVAFDEIFPTLEQCLKGIVKPFYVPGSQLLMFPKIYVTIIAHTPFFKSQPQQVIVQGWLLMNERENLSSFLMAVRLKLVQLQNQLAKFTSITYSQLDKEKCDHISPSLEENEEVDGSRLSVMHPMVTPDTGFVNMLRYGIIALQLLPENSMAGIIVITDGVISLPDATMFDALLVQLRNHTISCSFLQVGSLYQLHSSLGYVPFNDLMYFLANATFGAYIGDLPTVEEDYENGMNDYHKALLTWGFQKGFDTKSNFKLYSYDNSSLVKSSPNHSWGVSSLMRKKEWRAPLAATLNAVLSCRLREGYTIKKVNNFKESIQIILVLPWKYCISIEYHIVSSWPPSQCEVQTEVWIEANYEFLNDVTNKDIHFGVRSKYRQRMVAKYRQTLKELSDTDLLLEGLQSFPSSPLYFTLPDCVQKGIPVFYLNPQRNIPEPVDDFPAQFSNFWKPVAILNVMKWQKWFHTHRIGVILKHEYPLPKNLHITNSNGRFGVIQSRRFEQILTSFLAQWTDFALIENHSYIKFLRSQSDQDPSSFFVVRITSKRLPCLTIHLAFLGGTSGNIRNEILRDLKEKILNLEVKVRDRSRERKSALSFGHRSSSEEKNSPCTEAVNTVPCCSITHKPIEKILIWYDQKPWNFMSSHIQENYSQYKTSSANQSASNNKALLCRYLHHRRWIWGLDNSSMPRISTSAISRILNTLNRMRIHDDFQFAYTCNGIVTMVREFPMKLDIHENANFLTKHFDSGDMMSHCVVQYTMFPPHFVNARERESFSSDDDNVESENVEADGEAQLITECWVEPQNGVVNELIPSVWQGLDYKQLPETFFSTDKECIWNLITYECLIQFCQSSTFKSFSPPDVENSTALPNGAIEVIPYSLHLTDLLSRCLRAEILLSTFFQDFYSVLLKKSTAYESDDDKGNYILYSLILDHLNHLHNGKQFYLSDHDNRNLPNILASRTNEGQESPFANVSIDESTKEVPKWRCFVKFSSQNHFLLTLIPSTYRDLKLLFVNKSNAARLNVFHLLSTLDDLEELEAKHTQEAKDSDHSKTTSQSSQHLSFSSSGSQCHHALQRCSSISSRQLFASQETSGGSAMVDGSSKRTRYKSGPPTSNRLQSNSVTVDVIEPSGRERACSLQSNRDHPPSHKPGRSFKARSKEEVLLPATKDKRDFWTPDTTSVEKTRRRNVSMPAKAQKEMTCKTFNKSVSVEMMKGDRDVTFATDSKRLSQDSYESNIQQRRNHDPIYGSVLLPIYVFDCRLNAIISQFIDRSTREGVLGKDLYVNSMFKVDEESNVDENPLVSCPNTSHEAAEKHSSSPEPCSEEYDISVDSKCLRNLVDSIEKCQRRSFVMGVFDSLSQKLDVHELDVQAALDQCQEILLETNISNYLQVICGHLKDFNHKLNCEQRKTTRDNSFNLQNMKPDQNDSNNKGSECTPLKIDFPLCLLKSHQPCHELVAIHYLIQRRFLEILESQFKRIPGLIDFYYFCPKYPVPLYQTDGTKSKYWSRKRRTKKKSGTSSFSGEDEEPENNILVDADEDENIEFAEEDKDKSIEFRSEISSYSMNLKLTRQISQVSQQLSDLDEGSHLSVESGEENTLIVPPLFLHFTCTIRSGTQVLGTTSVNNLPTCLGDISHCVQVNELDVSKLSITLDALVMTLLGGATISGDRIRGDSNCDDKMRRTISFCSNNSIPVRTSESNNSNSDNEEYCVGEQMLLKLPQEQHRAVLATFDNIKWLIQDEIVSLKLHCYPVSEETLELVCDHVANPDSKSSLNCILESVPLDFVYGMDQSMGNFMQEFSTLKISGYQLEKQGNLYYLVLNQSTSRKWFQSSLIPSLNLASIISRHQTKELSCELTEDTSFPKTSLSSPDATKSPKKFPQKVSFETDICLKEEEAPVKIKAPSSVEGSEKWIKRRERKERRDSEKRGLAESSDSENDMALPSTKDPLRETTGFVAKESEGSVESLKESGTGTGTGISSGSRPDSHEVESTQDEVVGSERNLDLISIKPAQLIRCDSETLPQSASSKPEMMIRKSASTDDFDFSPSLDDQDFFKGLSTTNASSNLWSDLAKCNRFNTSGEIFRTERHNSGGDLLKSRHNSGTGSILGGGLQSDVSSLFESGQTTEDGCEGDISNSDECSDWLQDYEGPEHPLPQFWLIVKINQQSIETFFHHRHNVGTTDWKKVQKEVVKGLKDHVRLVNQKLLLENLHDTHVCNVLLEPGCSEDIWKTMDLTDPELDSGYLEATMKFKLGAFSCPKVWSKQFELHPRLKSGMGCKGNLGIQGLQAILNPFSVSNRKNMFVYEDSSGTVPNVFYLRLHEQQSQSVTCGLDGRRDESVLSRSSSVISLSKRSSKDEELVLQTEPRPRVSSFVEKDVIMEGVPSTPAQRKSQDYIVLTVHGIAEPGLSIKEHLVQMLQKRLDDTVLDSICLMLWSNRHHKLTPEDVHFIQPQYQSPSKVLQFSVNSRALLYCQAVSYYLRQNMQDSGFTKPKYPDAKPEHHFQDFSARDMELSTVSNIFLFVCSQKSGAKGVSCIAYSVVDSFGNAIQLANSVRMPWRGFEVLVKESDFQSLTHTSMQSSSDSATLDCEALFQFKIWESGRLEEDEIKKFLKDSIEHALWDLSMELRFLVAPIFSNFSLSPPISQPTSPVKTSVRNFGSPKSASVVGEKSSPLSCSQVDLKLPKSPLKTRHSVDLGKEQVHQRTEGRFTVEESDLASSDELQTLHPIYVKSIIPWLEYGNQLNVPSVRKLSVTCPIKSAIPTFITELQRWTSLHLGESTTKIFRRSKDDYILIEYTKNEKESHIDLIITNRNEKKWLMAVHDTFVPEVPMKDDKNMRFQSLIVPKSSSGDVFGSLPSPSSIQSLSFSSPSTNPAKQTSPHASSSCDSFTKNSLISRQMFFIATLVDLELTVFTYNWMKDLNEMLQTCLSRMCHWTSARNRLLSSLVFQKLGLFHHQPFVRKEHEFNRKSESSSKKEETNPFVMNLFHIEGLFKSASLCKDSLRPIERSGRRGQQPQQSLQNFCEVLRDSPPREPLQKSHHKMTKDLLFRHGMQIIETSRIANMKGKERRLLHSKIQSGSNATEFTEITLNLLKKHSRIIHFCLTALLFLPSWRYQVAAARNHSLEECPSGSECVSVKMRHESGTLVKSQVELRRSSIVSPSTQGGPSPNQTRRRHATGTIGVEDKWHETLCLSFLKEFIQYLHCLGFSTVILAPADTHKGKQGRHSTMPNNPREFVAPDRVLNSSTYLIKHVFGGIVILQINFLEPYFKTTVYILESTRTTQFRNCRSSSQILSSFIEEVERIKVVLHMHSFTYDYHLRAISTYVANRQLLFAQGYHLSSFLSDFIKYHNKGPNFARNRIHAGEIRIDDTGTSGEKLYNYLLAKEKEYNMRVLRMTPTIIDKMNDMYTEFILVHTKSYQQDSVDYEVTLLVSHDTNQETSPFTLHLKFYVILTSRRDMYPNNLPEKKSGRFRTVSSSLAYDQLKSPVKTGSSSNSQAGTPPASFPSVVTSSGSASSAGSVVKQHGSFKESPSQKQSPFSIRSESVNYLGYYSEYEEFMQKILEKQVEEGRNGIKNIFNEAKIHCRRDSLWHKLTSGLFDERKSSRDHQNSANLNFSEFCELLTLISLVPINELDPDLDPFLTQSIQWYQSLCKIVLTKYQDRTRILTSPDGNIQHIVVFSSNCPDSCMMLTINLHNQQGSIGCIRKQLEDDLTERTRVFLEEFVNCCCFHLWACLV